jgi:Glycosyltransferase family 87
VELLHRSLAPLVLLAAALALALPATAAARPPLEQPPSQTAPPESFRLSADQVERIADRAAKVREERGKHRDLEPTAYTRGIGRWQVSYFSRGVEEAQVIVDDGTGAILEQWSGPQVAWTMARGHEGAFGRKLNAPYVWLPLCLLFLAPFVDPRRPFRLLHLDLLVLLAFGVSHVFFNRGEISTSAPLVYPVLAYLLARMLVAGFRGRERREGLVPLVPTAWLAVGLVFLVAFRAGLNVVDSNVIDVGYSGVIGADRIVDGDELYGQRFASDNEHGDTYGPVNYLFYVPFEQALHWSGSWDDLPAAHGAALAADLLVILGLMLLGRRLRPGDEGRTLGLALPFAWAAYPYSTFALESNANDTLVAVAVVGAMLALTLGPVRRPAVAGVAIGLGAAAKFAPLALAPLFATASSRRLSREALAFALALAAVLALTVLPFVPDGGLRELYDRTLGYQAGRPSPFSVWGQEPSLDWLQTAVKAAAAGLGLLVAVVPRRKSPAQVAALGAAVLIALQLAMTHWFYLYVVWFAPLVLVALFAPLRAPVRPREPVAEPRELATA